MLLNVMSQSSKMHFIKVENELNTKIGLQELHGSHFILITPIFLTNVVPLQQSQENWISRSRKIY